MGSTPAPRAVKLAGSLAPTLVFGFASHVGVAVIGIVTVPLYLRLLGAEGYGLAGFYAVLQSWILLFDLGLSPAVARQLSRFRAGAVAAGEAASLLRAAEALFLAVGLAGGIAFFLAAGWVGRHWLGASHLSPSAIGDCLKIVAALLAVRWMAGLYQSALIGLERQIALNTVALLAALARSLATVAALLFMARSPVIFFAAQAVVSLAETAVYRLLLVRAAPRPAGPIRPGWSLLSRELRFAIGLAAAAALATLINQADKIALSHTLSLGDFGVFSLVVTLCAGISLVVPPIVQTFQPRLTTLLAQGRRAEFVHVYTLAHAVIIALTLATAGAIAAQPEMVIYAWTGHRDLAARLAPIVATYALGTGIASFLFIPFLLQYAQGLVRLQVIGNLVFGAVWVPAAVWAAFAFGPVGTGIIWLTGNLAFVVIWVPFVHSRLLSREERRGLGLVALGRVLLLGAALGATRIIPFDRLDRIGAFAILALLAGAVFLLGVFTSSVLRQEFARLITSAPDAPP
jgi:O-antigen/teichoic acid export membrane protein